jgi:uncharacterized protein (DUF305 family)
MDTKTILIAAAAIIVIGAVAYTQLPGGEPDPMEGMDHSNMKTVPASASASTKAYEVAMTKMMKDMAIPYTGKPDVDFVQGMMPHHQGAIDMAKVVLQYGKDSEIKSLAENVVEAQEDEIAFMKSWLGKADQASLGVSPDSTKGYEEAMAKLEKNMTMAQSGDADVDFVKGMIPHHQGAIDMAKVALQYAKDPEVLKLAQDVVTAQEGEIAFMNGWLAKHGSERHYSLRPTVFEPFRHGQSIIVSRD